MKRTLLVIVGGALALAAAGCAAVGPDYVAPEASLPASFREGGETLLAREAGLAAWWTRLGDPVLDDLVARAAAGSLDLKEAWFRVEEARARRRGAGAEHLPIVDARADYERTQESERTAFGSLGGIRASDTWSAGFDASWEIDLFGRIRRSVEAAGADLEAAVFDAEAVKVSLIAETASSYVDFRSFQERILIARRNVALQEGTVALVQARVDAGLASELELAQAGANLESTRARVPALEAEARAAENRLAVLIGRPPGALAAELEAPAPVPVPPLEVAVGVPSDLLRRRADVRQAERVLAAETARIGVAEAALYPRLSLFGSLGLAASDLGDLFSGPAAIFGFGPSLGWNVFDGGRLKSQVDAQDARRDQALARWQQAVLLALEEAENAMTSFVREELRRRALAAAAAEARRAVLAAETQYREGLTDFQPVLDTQRVQADLEDDLAASTRTVATRFVALYKSLGGGWE